MKVRFYFDIDIKNEGAARAAVLHGRIQDALIDVFYEEQVLPVDGLKMRELQQGEKKEQDYGAE